MPKNAKELHSFLGLVSYYHWLIPNFAHMARGLHQLIGPANVKKTKSKKKVKKGVKTLEKPDLTKPSICLEVRNHIALTTAPMLRYPNSNREFILENDASLKGLGAVLSQQDNTGKVHVIACTSQTLKPSEQSMYNYSSAKLKLLALKMGCYQEILETIS